VGEWWFDKAGGLRWDVDTGSTVRQYRAIHHVNVFGAAPRMVCGVVTRDRTAPAAPAAGLSLGGQGGGQGGGQAAVAAPSASAAPPPGGGDTRTAKGAAEAAEASGAGQTGLPGGLGCVPPLAGPLAGPLTGLRRLEARLPPQFLRPVVGTFTAVGDSEDTHDPGYGERYSAY